MASSYTTRKYEGIIPATEVKKLLVDLARTKSCDSIDLDAVEDSWDLKEPKNIFKDDPDYGVKVIIYVTMKKRDKEKEPRLQDNLAIKKFLELHPSLYKAN